MYRVRGEIAAVRPADDGATLITSSGSAGGGYLVHLIPRGHVARVSLRWRSVHLHGAGSALCPRARSRRRRPEATGSGRHCGDDWAHRRVRHQGGSRLPSAFGVHAGAAGSAEEPGHFHPAWYCGGRDSVRLSFPGAFRAGAVRLSRAGSRPASWSGTVGRALVVRWS